MRYLKAFAYFLWDFVVGDSPELAVGNTALLVFVLAVGVPAHSGALILPLVIVVMLTASVYVGKAQAKR